MGRERGGVRGVYADVRRLRRVYGELHELYQNDTVNSVQNLIDRLKVVELYEMEKVRE